MWRSFCSLMGAGLRIAAVWDQHAGRSPKNGNPRHNSQAGHHNKRPSHEKGLLRKVVRSNPSFYNRNIKNNELCNRDRLEINKSRVVWRGRSPSILNPQLLVRGARGACARGARDPMRHVRCEDEFLRSRACTARAKIFSLRLCRPGAPQGREAKARGFSQGGQVPLAGAVQQPLVLFAASCASALCSLFRTRDSSGILTARRS